MSTTRRTKGTGTLFERGEGRWLIRVDHGRNPATGQRDRRNHTFEGTKRAAQRRMNELLRERDTGLAIPPDRMTVADWLPGWLTRHFAEGAITPRVHDRYRGIIQSHLLPALGAIRLQDLRSNHVSDLKSRWLIGGDDSTSERPLSNATVYKHLMVLSQAMDDAVRHNLIVRNPLDAVTRPSTTRREEQRSLTEEEIGHLVKAVAGTRFDVAVRLTLSTGLRQAELLELTWNDVESRKRRHQGARDENREQPSAGRTLRRHGYAATRPSAGAAKTTPQGRTCLAGTEPRVPVLLGDPLEPAHLLSRLQDISRPVGDRRH